MEKDHWLPDSVIIIGNINMIRFYFHMHNPLWRRYTSPPTPELLQRPAHGHDTSYAQTAPTQHAGNPSSCPLPSTPQILPSGHNAEWANVETMGADIALS